MKLSLPIKHLKGFIFQPTGMCILIGLGIIPSLWLSSYFFTKSNHLDYLHHQMERIHKKSTLVKRKKHTEDSILAKMKGADPYYIDKYLESLNFLSTEQKKWQYTSLQEKLLPEVEKRLQFLKSDKNKLSFTEINITQNGKFKETEEKQKYPIEINEDDLKKLLSLVEGVHISPYIPPSKQPQFLIKEFHLTKKNIPEIQEKVFVLSMQFIKKELSTHE